MATAREPHNGAEQGFTRPYGKPYGLFDNLMGNRTVLHGRPKPGCVLGDRGAPDGGSRQPTAEALCA